MQKQKTKTRQEPRTVAAGKAAPAVTPATAQTQQGSVTVRSAGNQELTLPLAGKKVSAVRKSLITTLNIAQTAVAMINGEEVASGRILQDGETLEFVRKSGQKG